MQPAIDYSEVCSSLKNAFANRYDKNSGPKTRMIGLLFARPTSQIAKNEIIPNIGDFHTDRETTSTSFSQTLDRAKLRCRNDKRLLAELNWSIMAMAVAELFALREQLSNKRSTSSDECVNCHKIRRD